MAEPQDKVLFQSDPAGQPQSNGSGLMSDLGAGIHGAAATLGYGAAALTGWGGAAGWAANQQQIASNYEQDAAARGVPQSIEDVNGPTDLLKYAGGQLAESAPTLAAAGIGALLTGGSSLAVEGGAAVARMGMKDAVEKLIMNGMTREAAESAVGKGVARTVGGAAATYPMAFGQNVETQASQPGDKPINVGAAALAAVPEAALNVMAPEGRLARLAGAPVAKTGSRLANLGIGAAEGAVEQGAVGAAQAGIQETQRAVGSDNYDLLGAQSLKNIGEGFASGAVAGSLIEGGRGLVHAPGMGETGGISSRDVGEATGPGNKFNTENYQQAALDLQGGDGQAPGVQDTTGPGLRPKLAENAQAGAAGPTVEQAIDGLQSMHRDLSGQLQQLVTAGTDPGQIKAVSDQITTVEKHLQVLDATPDKTAQAALDFNSNVNAKTSLAGPGVLLFGDPTGGDPLTRAADLATATPAPVLPHPEPQSDQQAQINAIHDPTSAKDAALITPNTPTEGLNMNGLHQVQTPHGLLVTNNANKAGAARALGANMTPDQMGRMLGYTSSKGASDGTVVQALDAHGNVVHEEATNQQNLPQAKLAAQAMAPKGGSVKVLTAAQAVAHRALELGAEQRAGFQLQGHPTPQFDAAGKPLPAPAEVDHSQQLQLPGVRGPGENPEPVRPEAPPQPVRTNTQLADALSSAQKNREVDLAHDALANRKMGELEASRVEQPPPPLPGSPADTWETRARIAWKDMSDGSLQGFHKAMANVLGADSPEEAAARIREKAGDQRTQTAYEKFDAMHRAITGDTIEEGATRERTESARGKTDGDAESRQAEPGAVDADTREAEAVPQGREEATETPRAEPDQTGAAEAGAGGAAKEGPLSDYQQRAEDVRQHIAVLDSTRDPAEFQSHVNALYRMAVERDGDRAGSAADVYLHDPENGVTDENLQVAAKAYEGGEASTRVAMKSSNGADRVPNPDTGNRTPLPDSMKSPSATHTAQSMAQYLAANAKDPAIRRVMQMVAGRGDLADVPVHIVRDGDEVPQHVQNELGGTRNADAVTFAGGGKTPNIWAHADRGADEETMAHEVLHAAFPDQLDRNSDMGQLMKEVRERMQERGMLDTKEGKFFDRMALRNPNEFKAYGFTSPTFRRLLAELDKGPTKSLWQRFKDAVASAMKMPAKWLDKVMDRDSNTSGNSIQSRMESVLQRMLDNKPDVSEAEREAVYHQMSTTPEGAATALKEGALDVWGHLKAIANKVAFESIPTHAIADHFSHILPALKAVVRAIDDRTAAQHVLARRAAGVHDLIQKAFKAGDKSLDRYNQVIEDTQIAGIDPRTKGSLDRAQNNLLVAKENLDRANRATGSSPLQKASARAQMRRAVAAARLADNWAKMTEPEKKAVGASFDALKESIARRQQVADKILTDARDSFHDDTLDKMRADGASEKQIDDQILRTYGRVFRAAQEPYAPLKRYGDWVTTASSKEYRGAEQELRDARVAHAGEAAQGEVSAPTAERMRTAEDHLRLLTADPEHRIVEFHDSSVASQNRAAELRADHPDMDVQRFARADYMQHAGALNGNLVNRIIDAVGEQLPSELRDNVASVIREMYVDSLPDNTFDQSMAGRGGVAGYSTDFSRAVLDTLMRDSFNISTLEHGGALGDAMKTLDDQRRAEGSDTANNIYKALVKRVAFSTDHQNFRKWEQRISEVTHAFYLGLSPGFMLMNMMQMPMITMPMLYSRFGTHANGAITKAIADVWDSVKKGNLDHTNSARMTSNEKEVLTRLQNLGILNMTDLHDAANAARSSNIIDPQTVGEHINKGWEISKDMANLPAQYVETVNRAASALAAYRLAVEGRSKFGKMEHGAAMDYAGKIVRDSHVDYSAANSAAWLKAPGARFLFQFKKYQISMLSMIGLNMYDAFGHGADVKSLRNALADSSLSSEERSAKQQMLSSLMERRAVARRTLAGLYGSHYLLTGAMGMPFAGTAMALSNVMRNWYNDPEDKADTKTDLQNWLSGVMGVGPADVVMHGVFGGIFGVNAQRIGMGDMGNPIAMTAQRAGEGSKDMLDQTLLGLLGPSVGLSQQIFNGIDQMNKGNYARGMEQMLPRAAGDVLKATRYAEDGGADTPAGKVVTPLQNMDAIKEALGMQPEAVANAYQAKDASADAKEQFVSTRNGLIKSLAEARKTGGDVQGAQQQIDAFNERNPNPELRITMNDVLKAQARIGAAPKTPSAREKAITARTDKSAFAQ